MWNKVLIVSQILATVGVLNIAVAAYKYNNICFFIGMGFLILALCTGVMAMIGRDKEEHDEYWKK